MQGQLIFRAVLAAETLVFFKADPGGEADQRKPPDHSAIEKGSFSHPASSILLSEHFTHLYI